MSYSFPPLHHPAFRIRGSFSGVGACAPCAAAAAARGAAGIAVVDPSTTKASASTRAIATGLFAASTLVGVVGFAASAPIASTVGLGGVFISMLVLAMQPTPIKDA